MITRRVKYSNGAGWAWEVCDVCNWTFAPNKHPNKRCPGCGIKRYADEETVLLAKLGLIGKLDRREHKPWGATKVVDFKEKEVSACDVLRG